MERNKFIILISFIVFMLLPTTGVKAFDKFGEDPKKGTGPKHVEDAIEKGMEIVGKAKYDYGGGRDEGSYGKHMDCSAFVHYIWNEGAGIVLVNNNTKHAGTGPNNEPAVSTRSLLENMEVKTGVDRKDLKRGDLIFFPTHVGVYLGDNVMINSAGGKNRSYPGASLADISKGTYWGERYNGKVIRIEEGGKGITLKDDAEIDSRGGTDNSKTSNKSSRKKWEYESPFVEHNISENKTGVEKGSNVVGSEVSNFFTKLALDLKGLLYYAGIFLSAVFFVYSSLGVLWYYVISFRGANNKSINKFEKFIGISVYDKGSKFNILLRFGLSITMVFLFLTGLYMYFMVFIFEVVEKLGII